MDLFMAHIRGIGILLQVFQQLQEYWFLFLSSSAFRASEIKTNQEY
jgi:hypothetical protein